MNGLSPIPAGKRPRSGLKAPVKAPGLPFGLRSRSPTPGGLAFACFTHIPRAAALICGALLAAVLPGAALAQAANCLQSPVDAPFITSNFGGRFHPVHRQWRFHNGTDFRAPMYTRIKSASSGMVLSSMWLGGGGNTVTILGDNGIQTRYMHLTRTFVQKGQRVPAGYIIADSGNTGESTTAPHLHFETRANGGATPADPKSLLCQVPPGKSDAGPDSAAPRDIQASPGGPAPGSPAPGAGPTSAGDFNAMSLLDFLRSETERRFLNPQWYNDLADPMSLTRNNPNLPQGAPPAPVDMKAMLWREIAEMVALDNFIGYQKMLVRERIETMLAVHAANRARQHNKNHLDAARQGALNSGAGR